MRSCTGTSSSPTDGSAASLRASRVAARLAARLGARLTSVYVALDRVPTMFSGDKPYRGGGVVSPRVRREARAAAENALDAVAREAQRAGVPCVRRRSHARAPWQAIVRVARGAHCDLIVMASRRPRGLGAVGSPTVKTLAHSTVPVLVCR